MMAADTPHPEMTPADFKTAHEALGISADFLAARIGVHVNRIWAYELPARVRNVPENAAEQMRDLANAFDETVEYLTEQLARDGAAFIPRHVSLDAFESWAPQLAGWGRTSQGLLLAEIQRRLSLPIEYVAADA
jgi:transcriptional regulator with XRE-family HTH domain